MSDDIVIYIKENADTVNACKVMENGGIVKYDKRNTKSFSLKLNKNTDADILEKFEECGNVSQYLKQLVRQDIKK